MQILEIIPQNTVKELVSEETATMACHQFMSVLSSLGATDEALEEEGDAAASQVVMPAMPLSIITAP